MTLFIRLLGSPEVHLNESRVNLRGYKPLALLAYLLHHPAPQQRQHLVDLLFDNAADPRATLRWTLSHLRKAIGTEYFIANRQQIGFNFDADFWLDVTDFMNNQTDIYRGDFLQGIDVRDGHRFMDWLYIQRERYRLLLQDMLTNKTNGLVKEKKFHAVIENGHQLLQLDNLHEKWYRVLMRAYIQIGRKDDAIKLYETCRQVLFTELSIQPSTETQSLYRSIMQKSLPDKTAVLQEGVEIAQKTRFPVPLHHESASPSLFVTRDKQLLRLSTHFQKSLSYQGQLFFITGSAGRGKSALATHFASQLIKSSDVLIGFGSCNAFDGIGDAFLPFRDILDSLTGNVSWAFSQGIMTLEQAKQQWTTLLPIIRTLLQKGPMLFDTLIPIHESVKRLQWIGSSEALDVAAEIQNLQIKSHAQNEMAQAQLFQQTTDALLTLSEMTPLVLFLDDLHWSDRSSLRLLFHLARRIQKSRILIICTYRAEDVITRQEDDGFSLPKLLSEIRRLYGDITIDLEMLNEDENQNFVQSYLRSNFNGVPDFFERDLYQYTEGHPLFTIELLRSMRSKNQLVEDKNGRLVTVDPFVWEQLPERVEAIIEMRLQTLPESLQEMLLVAAIEGTVFTAQVVAEVVGLSERRAISILAQRLDKQHHILQYVGQQQLGERTVDIFQFQHNLLHHYLIGRLVASEKRLLHGEIADVLERLYADDINAIALPIANHYERAELHQKATHYFGLAAKLAANRFAHEEVIELISKAVALLDPSHRTELYALLCVREQSFSMMAQREAQEKDLAVLSGLADSLAEDHIFAEVALRHSFYFLSTGNAADAFSHAETAVSHAQSCQNSYFEAMGQLYLGRALLADNKHDLALPHFENALRLSREAQMQRVEATSLRSFGKVSEEVGELTAAHAYYRQALDLHQSTEHNLGKALALQNLGDISRAKGNYMAAQTYLLDALHEFQEIGHRQGEGNSLIHLGINRIDLGDYHRARQYLVRGLILMRKIGDRKGECLALSYLGIVALHIRDGETAVFHCQQAIEIAQETADHYLLGLSYLLLGRVFINQQQLAKAETAFAQSHQLWKEQNKPNLVWLSKAGMTTVALEKGNLTKATNFAQQIWDHWHQQPINGTQQPFWVLSICYTVFKDSDNELAKIILATAHEQLQAWAKQIKNQSLQHSFLNNIPEHAQIVSAFNATE